MLGKFVEILSAGGHANSLGRAAEVVEEVLRDKTRLAELYDCLSSDDAWVRMRAIDSIEKVCRVHPEWLLPYTDKLLHELSHSPQASIQWHLAEMYGELELTAEQKRTAINWMKAKISTADVDWIVAANTMKTLVQFTKEGAVSKADVIPLLKTQQQHKSPAVRKRADKLLNELE